MSNGTTRRMILQFCHAAKVRGKDRKRMRCQRHVLALLGPLREVTGGFMTCGRSFFGTTPKTNHLLLGWLAGWLDAVSLWFCRD